MKYCSNCGKEVDDKAVICPNCGCRIDDFSARTSLSTLSIIGFIFAFLFPLVGLIISIIAHSNAKKEFDERSRRFSKAGIIIAVCIMAFIFILYFIIFLSVFASMAAL